MYLELRFLRMAVGALASCFLCLSCGSASIPIEAGLDPAKRMTIEDGRLLALVALSPGPRHDVVLEQFEPLSPEFWGFEALRHNPGGSARAGSCMVNPWSGDVWGQGDPCHRIENPELTKLQEEIRKRLKLTTSELAVARALKPFCHQDP